MPRFRSSSHAQREFYNGQHRFEHWYRDNTVYFITARCRDRYHAFASADAKAIFWDRFEQYTKRYGFVPWITTLIDNHYHSLGYLRLGTNLGPMMQKIHGSVAKLVNDLLPQRRVPFWRGAGGAITSMGASATNCSAAGPIATPSPNVADMAFVPTGETTRTRT